MADLDGDGVYEAVVEDGYYEGGGMRIYSLVDTPTLLTGAGCGV